MIRVKIPKSKKVQLITNKEEQGNRIYVNLKQLMALKTNLFILEKFFDFGAIFL